MPETQVMEHICIPPRPDPGILRSLQPHCPPPPRYPRRGRMEVGQGPRHRWILDLLAQLEGRIVELTGGTYKACRTLGMGEGQRDKE